MASEGVIEPRYDAVIVGGGHNGLVAAAYLARAGQSVLLLERNPTLGGATASKALFPGFDARLSRYSYLVSLFPRAIVDDLALSFATRRRAVASCTPYWRDGAAGALILSNVDSERSRRSFEDLAGPADWLGYQTLLALEQALAARVWPSLVQPLRSRADWVDSLASPAERTAWEGLVEQPLGMLLERLIHHDLARGMLFTDAMIGLFTRPDDPSLLQNRCFILHTIGQGTGEWQVPVGGMGALVQGLAASARDGGAQLVTRATVEAIRPGHPYHSVVFRLGRDQRERAVDATRVLVNAGPQVFDRLLGELPTDRPEDEGSVGKVNLLLRRLPRLAAAVDPRDAFGGTFHVDEGYAQLQDSYREAAAGQLPAAPPVDVYCHTLTDPSVLGPSLRHDGYHTLTMFGLNVPYRLFERDNTGTRAILLERYLRGINRHLAEPIEDCLARDVDGKPCLEIKSPIDLEAELALNRGNIFHQGLSWFFAEDPAQAGTWGVETSFERIYRCGASALRGGAVSGIPGHNAARCIFAEIGAG
jgi:phytoene dehydrogenase-like protein